MADWEARRAYEAEWQLDPATDTYLTITQAKAFINFLALRQQWFRDSHDVAMAGLDFWMDFDFTKIRKGKATNQAGFVGSTRFHTKFMDVNYTSIVLASDGVSRDISKRTVVHELSHFIAGPFQHHSGIWRAIYISMLRKFDMGEDAAELIALFQENGLPVDEQWMVKMHATMGILDKW